MRSLALSICLLASLATAFAQPPRPAQRADDLAQPEEKAFLSNVRQLTFDGAICTKAAVAFGGVDDTPVRIPEFEMGLIGQTLAYGVPDAALDLIADGINPGSDQHASANYRRRVARTLANRAIAEAAADARGGA